LNLIKILDVRRYFGCSMCFIYRYWCKI